MKLYYSLFNQQLKLIIFIKNFQKKKTIRILTTKKEERNMHKNPVNGNNLGDKETRQPKTSEQANIDANENNDEGKK